MYQFGEKSLALLQTCDERLQQVAHTALAWTPYDFGIIEGHRTLERQQELFNSVPKKSHIDGITQKGNHNYMPSRAYDFLPFPGEVNNVSVWKDDNRFAVIAGVMFAAAAAHGIKIRWGGDWDGDGNAKDQSLYDLPHIELAGD